ncbi:MAG: hypothetical protein LBG74_03005 [Spirochaetaceae bacterium]|nr:hypothetical protein [Spirochaetaceae bacterium]
MFNVRQKLKAFLTGLCVAGALFAPRFADAAQGGLSSIADDSALRRQIEADWFSEAPGRVMANKKFIATLADGARVEIKILYGANDFTVSLAREENGVFSGWNAGSWAYTRTHKGEPVRLRFFPRSDPYTFIQFRPFNHNKSFADIVIYDAYISSEWAIPGSFESILVKPLPDIIAGLAGAPLHYFEPKPDNYRDARSLARNIRRYTENLRYEDDGAINKNGEYVFIKTGEPMGKDAGLNCSGYSKWVVDGILKPVTGSRLDINALKTPVGGRGSNYTDIYESLRDPYFGLDWVRNLAAAAGRAFKGESFAALDEIEVRQAPFSTIITRAGHASANRFYPGFLSEAGFGIEGLGPLLYTLAIDEPGYIYLGAINNDLGPRPRMRQYFHIAVFIPYFDDAGVFHVTLFESASENSFNRFRIRYPGHYINLVRIPVEGRFEP